MAAITKNLTTDWRDTKESWMDAKSAEFDRKYIEELIANVDASMEIMDKLDKVLAKIRSDCE